MKIEMSETYMKRLIELAKEIRELQLKESDLQLASGKMIGVSSDTIRLTSKINFLLGFILSLEDSLVVELPDSPHPKEEKEEVGG